MTCVSFLLGRISSVPPEGPRSLLTLESLFTVGQMSLFYTTALLTVLSSNPVSRKSDKFLDSLIIYKCLEVHGLSGRKGEGRHVAKLVVGTECVLSPTVRQAVVGGDSTRE